MPCLPHALLGAGEALTAAAQRLLRERQDGILGPGRSQLEQRIEDLEREVAALQGGDRIV